MEVQIGFACVWQIWSRPTKKVRGSEEGEMADGVDIDLYADDLEQGFSIKVCFIFIVVYLVYTHI